MLRGPPKTPPHYGDSSRTTGGGFLSTTESNLTPYPLRRVFTALIGLRIPVALAGFLTAAGQPVLAWRERLFNGHRESTHEHPPHSAQCGNRFIQATRSATARVQHDFCHAATGHGLEHGAYGRSIELHGPQAGCVAPAGFRTASTASFWKVCPHLHDPRASSRISQLQCW